MPRQWIEAGTAGGSWTWRGTSAWSWRYSLRTELALRDAKQAAEESHSVLANLSEQVDGDLVISTGPGRPTC